MQLKRKNKITTEFNMSSMTDLVFLLLVFFMLTSNFVTPSGLPVNLPSTSKANNMQPSEISVTITKDLVFLVGQKQTTIGNIENDLTIATSGLDKKNTFLVLNVDKEVPVEYFAKVASIANHLGLKVSLATKTDK
jgi:biopolymer transport protein ExbD